MTALTAVKSMLRIRPCIVRETMNSWRETNEHVFSLIYYYVIGVFLDPCMPLAELL